MPTPVLSKEGSLVSLNEPQAFFRVGTIPWGGEIQGNDTCESTEPVAFSSTLYENCLLFMSVDKEYRFIRKQINENVPLRPKYCTHIYSRIVFLKSVFRGVLHSSLIYAQIIIVFES